MIKNFFFNLELKIQFSISSSLITKTTGNLGTTNQEYVKSISYILKQLDNNDNVLSYLPFALTSKESNNTFGFHPRFFAILKEAVLSSDPLQSPGKNGA